MLHDEFQYYINNQDKLVNDYNGKYIVIKDQKVFGAYETEIEAYIEAKKEFELGTFLIQKCEPGEDAFTAVFYSRRPVFNQ
ncbi:MAG: hypothetical protein A2X61_07485 [Ignavibacteria bacterium GWB2_35_12]|nr:MAG: hypothetical protein A2X63_12785 [Ignavibacteria bacterium GWA2_35_8]OGU39170.1 MAG: hypothetical protein A2X61_07485 [Ignavibacteria bacterium GWB2_35_12]OGU89198.1 MAG: hypothetical protein A2220_00875 [Ignavibacteria bacterium RIFOXYA2_FULL_35_10]OGV21036.1 MAG: hypothetical protein A2475_00775 [Ignavibacteria bacterium RIFOXYC2_FULL_35_21]